MEESYQSSLVFQSFIKDTPLNKKLAKMFIENFYTQENKEFIFNTVQLEFFFDTKEVVMYYYAIDENYPNIVVSFEALENYLSDFLKM